jgi:hypothetical protein
MGKNVATDRKGTFPNLPDQSLLSVDDPQGSRDHED